MEIMCHFCSQDMLMTTGPWVFLIYRNADCESNSLADLFLIFFEG